MKYFNIIPENEIHKYQIIIIILLILMIIAISTGSYFNQWTKITSKNSHKDILPLSNQIGGSKHSGKVIEFGWGPFGNVCINSGKISDKIKNQNVQNHLARSGCKINTPSKIKNNRKLIVAMLILSIISFTFGIFMCMSFIGHGQYSGSALVLLIIGGIFALLACILWSSNKWLYKSVKKILFEDISQIPDVYLSPKDVNKKLGLPWYIILITGILSIIIGIIFIIILGYKSNKHLKK